MAQALHTCSRDASASLNSGSASAWRPWSSRHSPRLCRTRLVYTCCGPSTCARARAACHASRQAVRRAKAPVPPPFCGCCPPHKSPLYSPLTYAPFPSAPAPARTRPPRRRAAPASAVSAASADIHAAANEALRAAVENEHTCAASDPATTPRHAPHSGASSPNAPPPSSSARAAASCASVGPLAPSASISSAAARSPASPPHLQAGGQTGSAGRRRLGHVQASGDRTGCTCCEHGCLQPITRMKS